MNEIIFVLKVVRLHLRVDDTLQVYITSRNLVKKTDDVICKKLGDSQSTRARTSLESQPL